MIPKHYIEWAHRYNISTAALNELMAISNGLLTDVPPPGKNTPSEAWVQSAVRLEAARAGIKMFRNNVGAAQDATGRVIRYGLANDSKQMNAVIKSGDLIGIRPIEIKPHHVGTIIGQFISRECKKAGWKWSGDAHELAQQNWCDIINANGGDATFCNGTGTLDKLV